jgi:hypothetical protein
LRLNVISITFCFDKDHDEALVNRVEELNDLRQLVAILHVSDGLFDVCCCRTNTPDGKKDVIG